MRKVFFTVLLSSVLVLSGCGQQQEESLNQNENESISESKSISSETIQESISENYDLEVPTDFTGIVLKNDEMQYYTDGAVNKTYVGLAEYENQWWYIENGSVNPEYSGMEYKDGEMWYVNKGKIDTTYSGIVNFQGNDFNVTNGKVDTTLSISKPDKVVMDIPVTEVEDMGFTLRETVRHTPGNDDFETFDYEFTSKQKGLYRFIEQHATEGDGKLCSLEFKANVLDKFRNPISDSSTGKIYKGYEDSLYIRTISLNENDKYIFEDKRKTYIPYSDIDVGFLRVDAYFMKPYFNITGFTEINDSFNENIFVVLDSNPNENKLYPFACYDYVPSQTGTYSIWFDNIEISKGKELYSENNLFNVGIFDGDDVISDKAIYVHGNDAQVQAYLEEGKTYQIKLAVKSINNSEAYHNGDVAFTMHIGQAKAEQNISGYTTINDSIDYKNQKNIYTIKPNRKQTIQYELSQLASDANIDIEIRDSSGNLINSYNDLENGSIFGINEAMKNITYEITIIGDEVTDYVLSASYS